MQDSKLNQKALDPKKDYLLSSMWTLFYQAHSNTSFSPEKRADQYVIGHSAELKEDLEKLGEKCGNYEEKYKAKLSAWMSAKSRCISTMITGPANFPVRRAEKANRSERNKSDEFYHWREKYFKLVNRVKTLSPEAELDKALAEYENLVIFQEQLKEYNKVVVTCGKKSIIGFEAIEMIKALDISPAFTDFAEKDVKMWDGKIYKMSTQAGNIRKLKEKVEVMKSRIDTKANWQDIKFDGGYITLEDDRVKIFHDDKPDSEVIALLKRSGFKWSRNWGCWCRKHTGRAVLDAKWIIEQCKKMEA